MGIYDEYLAYQHKYSSIYGKDKTIVFMQVGSFYEAYGTETEGFPLKKLSSLINVICTQKNKEIKEVSRKNPYMVGFQCPYLSKYMKILLNNNFTVVVFDQFKVNNPHAKKDEYTRELAGVYSNGTYVENNVEYENNNYGSNHVMTLYIDEFLHFKSNKNIVTIGITLLNNITNYSMVHESCGTDDDYFYALDETIRIIKSYKVTEIIVCYKSNSLTEELIIKYLELESIPKYYLINVEDKKTDKMNIFNKDFLKVDYQNLYLSNVFDSFDKHTILEEMSIDKKPMGTISLMIMVEYIKNHNTNLLKNLMYPEIFIHQNHLILGNNAIEQLNVINNNNLEVNIKQYQSLFDVINKTKTHMGKRFLKESLLNPLSKTQKKKIIERYNYIEEIKENNLYIEIDKYMESISDIEKLHRKMSLNMLYPKEFGLLDNSYKNIIELLFFTNKNDHLNNIITEPDIIEKVIQFKNHYSKLFDIDKMNQTSFSDMYNSFYNEGTYEDLDKLQFEVNEVQNILNDLVLKISSMIKDKVYMAGKKENFASVEMNTMEGYYISITKRRLELFKEKLKSIKNKSIEINGKTFNIDNFVIKDEKHLKNAKIFIKHNDIDTSNVMGKRDLLSKTLKKYYLDDCCNLYLKYNKVFQIIVKLISFIDFLNSGAKVANDFYYNKPIIKNENKEMSSYLKAKSLRHPIIERINVETEYIPHDVILGNILKKDKMQNGMLVYGLNSAGKTSLMKSIGLAVILAQIGYFVPAEKFIFEPYNSLYARITGNDNLFKGYSSFQLEMIELEAILKRIKYDGENILVIGDEIARGSEWKSGISIVSASLKRLSEANTSFIFASHLHELKNVSIVTKLDNLRFFNIAIEYDKATDKLIFNRKLIEGTGASVYGIKVAKYIIKDNDFIQDAENVLNEIERIESNDNIILKKSKYNSKVILNKCAICGYKPKNLEKDLDTHHIVFQCHCENNRVINKKHINKNHSSNLCVLCKECHQAVHNGKINISGYKETTRGKDLIYNM